MRKRVLHRARRKILLATEKQEVLFVLSALTLNSSSCIEYSFKKFAKQKDCIRIGVRF